MLPKVVGGVESCGVVVLCTEETEGTAALVLVGANAEETLERSDEGIGIECAEDSEDSMSGVLIEVGEERRVFVLACTEAVKGSLEPVLVGADESVGRRSDGSDEGTGVESGNREREMLIGVDDDSLSGDTGELEGT